MKRTISKYPLAAFFLMAQLFSTAVVVPRILNHELPTEPFLIFGAFAGPTFSALIIIVLTEGKTGLWAFFKRYGQWRAGVIWWIIVLFGILIALNIVATFFLGPSVLIGFFKNLNLILPTYAITLIFGVILGPLWEEGGWRGFALPHLQKHYGSLAASIVIGVMWAFWHIPGYLGGWMEANFLALLIYCIGFSIIATWIFNHTRASILLMILLHSSSNAAISVGATILPSNLPVEMQAFIFSGWIPAITSVLVSVMILILTTGNLGYQEIT